MIFLSHPTCSSGFIYDFVDHYTLEWQKAVSAYLVLFKFKRQHLLTCKVRRYCLLDCTPEGLY